MIKALCVLTFFICVILHDSTISGEPRRGKSGGSLRKTFAASTSRLNIHRDHDSYRRRSRPENDSSDNRRVCSINSAGYSTPNSSDLFKIPLFVSEHKDRLLYPFEIDELSNLIKVRHGSIISMCCPEQCIKIQCGRTVQGRMRFLNLTSQMFISSISRERCKRPLEAVETKISEHLEFCDRDDAYGMGFNIPELPKDQELYTYKVCLNKGSNGQLPRVTQTYHVLKKEYFNMPSLEGIQLRNDWNYDTDVYSVNPNQFYRLQPQKKSIARHCANFASRWFKYDDDENQYFIRSQHVPEADHSKIPQKRLTFNMMNVAPQWQPFVQGEWKNIEDSIRTFINDTGIPLEIVSGNWGTIRCPGTNTPIYLNRGAAVQIGIPKLFYKVIKKQDETHDERFLLVMVNDPSVTDIRDNEEYNICNGRTACDDLQWFKDSGFKCNVGNPETGLTYACVFDQNIRSRLRSIE